MVVGDGEKMPCALVQPDFEFAKNWALRNNLNIGSTPEEIAKSPELKQRIEKEIEGINEHLGNWEKIKKLNLLLRYGALKADCFTPTLKLKRKAVKENLLLYTIRCMIIRNK